MITLPVWLTFIILALAAYRITRFFTDDTLLDAIRWRLKDAAYIYDENDEIVDYNPVFVSETKKVDGVEVEVQVESKWRTELRGKLVDLVICPFCLGFWVTGACLLAWIHAPSFVLWIVLWFGLAGAQSLISSRPGA